MDFVSEVKMKFLEFFYVSVTRIYIIIIIVDKSVFITVAYNTTQQTNTLSLSCSFQHAIVDSVSTEIS